MIPYSYHSVLRDYSTRSAHPKFRHEKTKHKREGARDSTTRPAIAQYNKQGEFLVVGKIELRNMCKLVPRTYSYAAKANCCASYVRSKATSSHATGWNVAPGTHPRSREAIPPICLYTAAAAVSVRKSKSSSLQLWLPTFNLDSSSQTYPTAKNRRSLGCEVCRSVDARLCKPCEHLWRVSYVPREGGCHLVQRL